MSESMHEETDEPIRLRSGRRVELHDAGFRHPKGSREAFTAYADLIHMAISPRGLRVGTRAGSFTVRRSDFVSADDALTLAQQLRARVAALADGPARLAHMDALDDRMRQSQRPVLSMGLSWLCWILFGLQLFVPQLELEGVFSAPWVEAGERWRLVTSQFLHAGLMHLALNTLCLWVLGNLLERTVGRGRAAFVLLGSGIGAGWACLWAAYEWSYGISGIVSGVVGALLVLELVRPESIPVPWRLPRLLLIGVIAFEAVGLSFFDNVAHAAHAGGFVAGGAAALVAVPQLPPRATEALRWRAVPWVGALVVLLAFAQLGRGFLDPVGSFERRATRLLANEEASAELLNNEAWLMAVSDDPSPTALETAQALAERAVQLTERADANFLDTLAEVYFIRGDRDRAIATIDEAIALSPDGYFREQRRRYTGDRAADDRPDPPSEGPGPNKPRSDEPPPGSIRI